MKNPNNIEILFLLTIFFSLPAASAQQKTIIVSGKVIDSITNAPISQATVLLYATASLNISNLGDLKLDTVFTDLNGNFSHSMSVVQNAIILIYGVVKQDYQIKYSIAGILFTNVNLETIKLSKVDALVKDTIVVSGTVDDSASGIGVEGAVIIMSGLGSFDTTGNTVITGTGGTFSKQVIAGNAASDRQLIYMVSKDGFGPMVGQQQISGKTLDLGKISLKRTSQGIITASLPICLSQTAVFTGVYSLKGQLLYVGPLASIDKKIPRHSGIAIAVFRNQNGEVRAKKVMATK